ncbi:MAG: hypothetical protein K2L89_01670 [Muribaculaceae bacterium]|nr:hypothetical protein [Muribaculaceae bacterium]
MNITDLKGLSKGLTAVLLTLSGYASAYAAESSDEPIITFHTTVYDNADVENVFHISLGSSQNTYIDVDCGYGKMEEEITPALFDGDTQKIQATYISCTVSKEGIVKIYGDASLIDYIDFEGCYIDEVSFPTLTEVTILNLEHNLLNSLDLSHMKKLQALYLSDNPFTGSPLVVGDDKPNLTILEMNIIEHVDPGFNITTYPNLVSFSAYSVPTLPQIDPTKCPELMRLTVDATPQSFMDVTKNPKLLILNISQTNITSVDLSKNPYLTEFYCTNDGSSFSNIKMKEVDVTNNPELKYLFISGNNLTTIDLSKNLKLTDLYASRNSFTSIDIENNQELYNVNLRQNNLDFATLPAPRSTFGDYTYEQKPLPVQRSYKEGTEIDFSNRVLRPNTLTSAKLFRTNKLSPLDVEELGDDYFAYNNGKITLKKECPDSLYVEFYNTMFMEAPLKTENFMVKNAENYGKPSPVVNIGFSAAATTVKMSVGMAGATPEKPVTFFVDFGNGTLKEFTATSSTLPETPNVSGKRAGNNTIVYLPEGELMTAFGVSQGRINTSDFTQATHISQLVINNTAMKEIDLQWNNLLTYLNLDNNALTSLNLSGATPRYEKNLLSDISAANNKLSSVYINIRAVLRNLNLSGNLISELPLDGCFDIEKINVADNRLTTLDLNDCMGLTTLDCSNNLLTSLPVPYYCPLKDLNISYNNVTFANLAPVGSYETYIYAPQNKVQLPTKAPSANLRNYLFTDDKGQSTAFAWYTVEGNTLLTSDQIEEDNGAFRFLDTELGEVYCSMTHPAFPDFSGENTYRTTDVLAAEMPKNVFCSFTTTSASLANLSFAGTENGTTIYIDWKGNGNLEQYILKDTYTRYTASVPANTEVKCYSYDENDNMTVFSVDKVNVSKLDASKMKQLINFSWTGNDLSKAEVKYPQSEGLQELNLNSSQLSAIPVDGDAYPALKMLNMSGNNLTSVDLTPFPTLQLFYGSANKISEVKLNNPKMWNLSLDANELESIDLSKAPSLQQVYLNNNKLSSIDFSGLSSLRTIYISKNNLTFATLPVPQEQWLNYIYSNQNPMEIEVKDQDTVDLSSQAVIGGKQTNYRWFVGSPWFDEYGDLTGEELILDEEYTIKDGISKFNIDINDIMCVMTNPLFPNLYLYTYLVDVRGAAIEEITADETEYEYYTLDGLKVTNPGHGIYIRKNNKKSEKIMILK